MDSTSTTTPPVYYLFLDPKGFKTIAPNSAIASFTDANEVKISNGSVLVVKYGDPTLTLSLYGLSFSRKLYKPGHIQAELLIVSSSLLSVSFLSEMLQYRPVKLSLDQTTVAEHYYIHEIMPQFESKTENGATTYFIYVKLVIYSMDKLLTLTKYSRAYLGRRLREDIVTETLPQFPLSFGDDDALPLIELESTDNCRLQHLAYDEEIEYGSSQKATVRKELIHPYLVQYNESFYDFLVRVANRCGEPLYFENGKLCFGLSVLDGNTSITNPARIIFQRISENSVKENDYTRDSVKQWDEISESYELDSDAILKDPVKMGDDGFPEDAFPEVCEGAFPHFRNAEIATDDQYLLLYKNKFAHDDATSLWWGDTATHLVSMLGDVLNSTSLAELLASWATNMVLAGIRAGIKQGEDTKEGNEVLEKHVVEPDDTSAVMYAKVDCDPGHWISLHYLSDIKSREESQMRQMVCVDMGDQFIHVKLGDKITLPYDVDTPYVVVQVEIKDGVAWQRRYEGYLGNGSDASSAEAKRSLVIYAIPMYDDGDSTASDWVFYPPLLSSNPFRQCGPQPAFVIDNKDLTGQGRVRIRFPWQQSLSMEDSKITDYEDALEEAKDKQEDAEEALEPYAQDDSIKVNDVVVTATKLTSVAETVFEESRKKYEDAIKDYYKKKTGAAEQEMLEARRLFEAYVVLGSIEVKEHVAEAKKKSDVSETKYTEYFTAFQTAVTNRYEAERTLETAKAHRAIAEAGTPWIRMATPTATTGGGMFFKPETGDEVMVDFENGNIERPFVVGTLYSKNVRVPSGGRVIMSKNGHSIKMSDPTDGTLFLSGAYPGLKFLQSFSKDIKIDFLKDKMNEVLGGIELSDKYGLYSIKMSSHDRNISISSPLGDVRMNAFTGISINAPNGDIRITGKNVDITAYNKLSIKSGKNIRPKKYGKTGTWKDRSGYITMDAAELGKTITSKIWSKTFGQFLDLSLFRSILEVVIRPVDGTLQIKSNRYVLVEAGDGATGIETANYDLRLTQSIYKKAADFVKRRDRALKRRDTIPGQMRSMGDKLTNYALKYIESFRDMFEEIESWDRDCTQFVQNPPKADILKELFHRTESIRVITADIDTLADDYADHGITYTPAASAHNDAGKDIVKMGLRCLLSKAYLLAGHIKDYDHLLDDVFDSSLNLANDIRAVLQLPNPFVGQNAAANLPSPMPALQPTAADASAPAPASPATESLSASIDEVKKYINEDNVDATLFDSRLDSDAFDEWLKFTKRRIACVFIEKCRATKNAFKFFHVAPAVYAPLIHPDAQNPLISVQEPTHPDENFVYPFSDNDWDKYVKEIRLLPTKEESGMGMNFLGGAWDAITDSFSKLKVFEENVWTAQATGQILLSDEKGKTYRFKNGGTERYDNPDRDAEEMKGTTQELHNSLVF